MSNEPQPSAPADWVPPPLPRDVSIWLEPHDEPGAMEKWTDRDAAGQDHSVTLFAQESNTTYIVWQCSLNGQVVRRETIAVAEQGHYDIRRAAYGKIGIFTVSRSANPDPAVLGADLTITIQARRIYDENNHGAPCTAVVRLAGVWKSLPDPKPLPYDDVPPDYWAAGYISQVGQLGIMTGRTPTTFDPTSAVRRDQEAKIAAVSVAKSAG